MPKKKLRMSHRFLTGMFVLTDRFTTGPAWDCRPYDQAKIAAVNNDKTAIVDLPRTPWFFGDRKMNAETGLVEKQKSTHFDSHEEFMRHSQNTDQPVNLSLEESQAVYAFSDSLGDGNVVQSGSVRGVEANSFNGWARANHLYVNFPGYYEEGNRIKRLPDGSIGMSSYLEIYQASDKDQVQNMLGQNPSNGEPLLQISSEQIVKKTGSEDKPIYTLTPHRQEVWIDEAFYKNVLLVRAKEKLVAIEKNNTVMSPNDLMALIPLLEDKELRASFCAALAKQPDFVFAFTKNWTMACHGGEADLESTQLGLQIFDELTKAKAQAATLKEKDKPRMLVNNASSKEYIGYLYDSSSEKEFRQMFGEEMAKMNRKSYEAVISTIYSEKQLWCEKYHSFLNDFQGVIINRAKEKLNELKNKNEVFKPSDLFALMTELRYPEVRKLFFDELRNQPSYVISYAQYCINVFYQNDKDKQYDILKDMNNILSAPKKDKNSPAIKLESVVEYMGYLYGPSSGEFRQTMAKEIAGLPEAAHEKVMADIQSNQSLNQFIRKIPSYAYHPGNTEWEGNRKELIAEVQSARTAALEKNIAPTVQTKLSFAEPFF